MTGADLCFFEADTEDFYFAMQINAGYTGTKYDVQLWQDDPNGSEIKVGDYETCSFGKGVAWIGDLTIGNNYHVRVSSRTISPGGASCTYIWSTEAKVPF